MAQLTFDDSVHPRAEVTLHPDGRATSKSLAPDLSRENVQKLLRRLISTFLSQGVRGKLHGDLQGGNIHVLADGRGFGLLDYGQMIDFSKGARKAPYQLLRGALNGKLAEVAVRGGVKPDNWMVGHLRDSAIEKAIEAVVDMSEDRGKMSRAERNALVDRIVGKLVALMERPGEDPVSGSEFLTELVLAANESSLVPSSDYFHSIKTSAAMVGNIAELIDVLLIEDGTAHDSAGKQLLGGATRVVGEISAEKLRRVSGTGKVFTRPLKNRRAAKLSRMPDA